MNLSTLITVILSLDVFAFCQEKENPSEEPIISESIEVAYSSEDFRSRSSTAPPVLIYSKTFFERFEPLSVGDILKRIPGISGSADAGEFNLPQLRGIGAQYTQITINGRRLPGSENNHTLFVDRIPANMLERLEIIRSPSSDNDSQGIGGTINIVLKDASKISSLKFIAGLAHFEKDSENRGQTYLSYGDSTDRFAYSFDGAHIQRYNPKRQTAHIFDEEGETVFKDETNTLDSLESSFRLDGSFLINNSSTLSGQLYLLSTDRDEIEDASVFSGGEFEEGEFDHARIRQDNLSGHLRFHQETSNRGHFQVGLDFSRLTLDTRADFGVFEGNNREREAFERDNTRDSEIKLYAFSELWLGKDHRIKYGLDIQHKRRKADKRYFELEEETFQLVDSSGQFTIKERRVDPYILDDWRIDENHLLETGLRLEITDLQLQSAGISRSSVALFPSIHYRFKKTPSDIFRLSLARTTRRQDFQELQPFSQRDQPRDGDTLIGNPNLLPEFALGFDAGYEHRFSQQEGILGLNLFFRQIENLVDIEQVGEDRFQPRNLGDGQAYGLEIDIGFPLDKQKLPNISIYSNLTLQDSRRKDTLTNKDFRFNTQVEYVANLGMLHFLPFIKSSYGFNWLKQGQARERFLTESVTINYGNHLDFLFEKKWGKGFSIRFAAKNLLNGTRDEHLLEYLGLRTEDAIETRTLESEASGRSYSLTFRGVF